MGVIALFTLFGVIVQGVTNKAPKKEESENKALLLPMESAPKKTTFGNSTTKKTDRSLTLREMKSESNI